MPVLSRASAKPNRSSVSDSPTAGAVVRYAIAASVARLLRHDPIVRVGGDPEGVHQARVATRRLRSDLRGIKKEVTLSGNIRFAGESGDSHCDRFWAKALRQHAARMRKEVGAFVA